jgi:rhodanese-related sulfurtransferase
MKMILLIIVVILIFAYKRYAPVKGVSPVQSINSINEDAILLDLRDYQTTYKEPIPSSINIPYAYLKRYNKEIPNKPLVIVASDTLEKNLAIRFLIKRRFKILGYVIVNEKRGENPWNITCNQKTV